MSRGISEYDRIYLPGGPGALGPSGGEVDRNRLQREEFLFLLEAHLIEEVILIFHGPSEDGPADAVCADYRRIMPFAAPEKLRAAQVADAMAIWTEGFGKLKPSIQVFFLEVCQDHHIHFVEWKPSEISAG